MVTYIYTHRKWLYNSFPLPDNSGVLIGDAEKMRYFAISHYAKLFLSLCKNGSNVINIINVMKKYRIGEREILGFIQWAKNSGLLFIYPDVDPLKDLTTSFDQKLWGFELDTGSDRILRYYRLKDRIIKKNEDFGNGRVMLTGGSGELGSLLTTHLLNLGYEVSILDTYDPGTRGVGLKVTIGDIRNKEAVRTAMHDCNTIIHLAGIKGGEFETIQADAWSINVDGTKVLYEVAKELDVENVIFTSSIAVHSNEEGKIAPVDNYGFSKWVGEKITLSQFSHPFIFRIAQVVHQDILYRANLWEFSESQLVEYVDSTYVISILSRAISSSRDKSGIYLLSGGQKWQKKGGELADLFHSALPGEKGRFTENSPLFLGWFNTRKTVEVFGENNFSIEEHCLGVRNELLKAYERTRVSKNEANIYKFN
ncbi:NAD-dependent epimerase/dehydratase family protein [Lederbergia ruris]|uniref:NAD-dependent epimerase/dehydratase family protein n=1 Tax=Lederbergia ruris TaxID=217495 RepID=UPI0039A3E213